MPVFGPLFDGALVPRALLGPLVRETSIAANRAVLNWLGRSQPRHAMSYRARDISTIVQRYAMFNWSIDSFYSYCLFANNLLPEEANVEGLLVNKIHIGDSSSENLIKEHVPSKSSVPAKISDVLESLDSMTLESTNVVLSS